MCTKVENSSFVDNRVLPGTDSDFATFVEEGYTYEVYPPADVTILNAGDLFDNSTTVVNIFTTVLEGHGGGIALSLIEVRPSSIVQILFQNLVIEGNEAVVGGMSHTGWYTFIHTSSAGGMSADMTGPYWNSDDRPTCASIIVGFELCQKFEVHNVTVANNKAEFAGGVYVSHRDGIVASCGPEKERFTASDHASAVTGTDVASRYCVKIQGNSRVDGKLDTAEAATRAVQLHVEGGSQWLKRVASGEALALPCQDRPNSSCSVPLRIVVKDAFNQTIDGGIEDANLDVSIISDDIVGDQRYSAVKGIVTIDNTQAWGINRNSIMTIASQRDSSISVDLHLSTRECYPGEIEHDDVCNACPTDQYSFLPSRMKCESCEENAECAGGAVLLPTEGYWHSTPFSPVFHKCAYFTACHYDRRREKLMQFYEDPEGIARQLDRLDRYLENNEMGEPDFSDYKQCDEGYGGPLCGSCQQGYGHSYTGECEACPERRSAARLRFFFIIVFLFFVVGTNCIITLVSSRARVTLAKHEMKTAAKTATGTLSAISPAKNPSATSSRPNSRRSGILQRCLHSHAFHRLSRLDFSDVGGRPDASTQLILAQQLVATLMLTETLKARTRPTVFIRHINC